MNCDFLTRSKWSFDAKVAGVLLSFAGDGLTGLAPEYNVCGTEYDVEIALIAIQ
jgi:hypothetical protein